MQLHPQVKLRALKGCGQALQDDACRFCLWVALQQVGCQPVKLTCDRKGACSGLPVDFRLDQGTNLKSLHVARLCHACLSTPIRHYPTCQRVTHPDCCCTTMHAKPSTSISDPVCGQTIHSHTSLRSPHVVV